MGEGREGGLRSLEAGPVLYRTEADNECRGQPQERGWFNFRTWSGSFRLPRETPQHIQITRFTPRKVASRGASGVISIKTALRFHARGPVAAACFPYMTTSTQYIQLWLTFPTATACDSLPAPGAAARNGHPPRDPHTALNGLGTIHLVQRSVMLGARYAIKDPQRGPMHQTISQLSTKLRIVVHRRHRDGRCERKRPRSQQ